MLRKMLQALLTPRAIHGMLILGGGLSVLGLIVWLSSLGVFENKIVLAAVLALGTLSVLAAGWLVTLRTRYRLAGQALTFLACVVAPLNLWFYQAQHLLTLDHGLWIGGVVCCLLYAATVYVLADPIFMFAIEAGITLTVVLLLGQLGLSTNTSYLCLSLMALGLASVHAERAFPPEDKVFNRRRFGMALFWSGHAQTAAALVLLVMAQLSDWLLGPGHAWLGEPWIGAYPTTWLLVAALVVVAATHQVSAFLCRATDARRSTIDQFFSATALLLAASSSLRMLGLGSWTRQAPLLLLVPIAYLIAGRTLRRRGAERQLIAIAHVAAIVILLFGFVVSQETFDRFLHPMQYGIDNFWLGLVLAEAAVFYSLAALFQKESGCALLATAAACGALWQWLGYGGIPADTYTMVYAAAGVCLLAASRMLGVQKREVATGPSDPLLVGRGLLLFQCGNAIVAISLLAAIMQGVMGLPSLNDGGGTWLHVGSLVFTAAAGGVALLLMPTANWRRAYAAMSIGLGSIALVTLGQLSHLSTWQKLEVFSTLAGSALIVASYIGRFREAEGKPDDRVTLGLWLGSLLATAPLAIAVVYHRSFDGQVSLPDELALLTISVLMLLTGFVWQVKSTTLFGGGGLGLYLVVLIVSLGWRPQLAIGVYLAVGGGLLFACGIALSVYRQKLLEIPEKIANREGLFRIMNWR